MKRHANKSSRKPSESPDLLKVALIVFLANLAEIYCSELNRWRQIDALALSAG
jgi:hypothetical protein